MHAFDRQTDRILIAKPRLQFMQRSKNHADQKIYNEASVGRPNNEKILMDKT